MEHTQYRIGVITNASGPSMQDMISMSEENNIVFDQIRFPYIPLSEFKQSDLVAKICSYDVVYYRTGMRGPVVYELSKILAERNIPCVNCLPNHPYIHEKIRQSLTANRFDIEQPKTVYVRDFDYARAASALGEKFVIKPDNGSQGNEVTLINNAEELEAFRATKTKEHYLYQEFIEDAEEYRVYTIGGKGVTTYKKVRGKSDFRANLHAGGTMIQTEPDRVPKLLEFGGQVASCFGADIAGIDILHKGGKYLFLELNLQPGWENLEELTGKDFCKKTLQYLLERAHQGAVN